MDRIGSSHRSYAILPCPYWKPIAAISLIALGCFSYKKVIEFGQPAVIQQHGLLKRVAISTGGAASFYSAFLVWFLPNQLLPNWSTEAKSEFWPDQLLRLLNLSNWESDENRTAVQKILSDCRECWRSRAPFDFKELTPELARRLLLLSDDPATDLTLVRQESLLGLVPLCTDTELTKIFGHADYRAWYFDLEPAQHLRLRRTNVKIQSCGLRYVERLMEMNLSKLPEGHDGRKLLNDILTNELSPYYTDWGLATGDFWAYKVPLFVARCLKQESDPKPICEIIRRRPSLLYPLLTEQGRPGWKIDLWIAALQNWTYADHWSTIYQAMTKQERTQAVERLLTPPAEPGSWDLGESAWRSGEFLEVVHDNGCQLAALRDLPPAHTRHDPPIYLLGDKQGHACHHFVKEVDPANGRFLNRPGSGVSIAFVLRDGEVICPMLWRESHEEVGAFLNHPQSEFSIDELLEERGRAAFRASLSIALPAGIPSVEALLSNAAQLDRLGARETLLKTETGEHRVHTALLLTLSKPDHARVVGQFRDSKERVWELGECSDEATSSFVQLLYAGNADLIGEIPTSQLPDLLAIAKFMQIEWISDGCQAETARRLRIEWRKAPKPPSTYSQEFFTLLNTTLEALSSVRDLPLLKAAGQRFVADHLKDLQKQSWWNETLEKHDGVDLAEVLKAPSKERLPSPAVPNYSGLRELPPDLQLTCDGLEPLKANRFLLALHSRPLSQLLAGEIHADDYPLWKAIFDYCKTGRLEPKATLDLVALYREARELELFGLQLLCERQIVSKVQIGTVEELIRQLNFAVEEGLSFLQLACSHLAWEQIEVVVAHPAYAELSQEAKTELARWIDLHMQT